MLEIPEFKSKTYSGGKQKNELLTPTLFSPIFRGDMKYFMTKSTWFITFCTQTMARASDPGGSPRKIRGNFGLLRYAEIPGVTSKFGISALEGVGPTRLV